MCTYVFTCSILCQSIPVLVLYGIPIWAIGIAATLFGVLRSSSTWGHPRVLLRAAILTLRGIIHTSTDKYTREYIQRRGRRDIRARIPFTLWCNVPVYSCSPVCTTEVRRGTRRIPAVVLAVRSFWTPFWRYQLQMLTGAFHEYH